MHPPFIRRPPRCAASLLALPLLLVAVQGCARKAVEAPPARAISTPAKSPATTASAKQNAAGDDHALHLDFSPAFFDYDSHALRADARAALDRTARLLRERPDLNIVLEGHCDERGTSEYNLALGERRAEVARQYLIAAGISAGRIHVISYGKERPFALDHGETAWAQNRRAHVVAR